MNEASMGERPADAPAVGSGLTELRSSQAKLVYLGLEVASGSTVDDLRTSLGIPALTLYPTLELLIDRDLVEREGETYVLAHPSNTGR